MTYIDNLSTFYRLNLFPLNKYFTSEDFNDSSTTNIMCSSPNKYCYKNSSPFYCDSYNYLQYDTNSNLWTCAPTCPAGRMVNWGSELSSPDVRTGSCSIPCGTSRQCMSNYKNYNENFTCNSDYTKLNLDCYPKTEDYKAAFFWGGQISTPLQQLTIPVKERYDNYFLEIWYFADIGLNVKLSAGYVFVTNGLSIQRTSTTASDNNCVILDPLLNIQGSSFNLDFGQWHRLIFNVTYSNSGYNVNFYYNKFSNLVSFTSTQNLKLENIYFCSPISPNFPCGHINTSIPWSSGFYKNLKIWDATNMNISLIQYLDQFYNIENNATSFRLGEVTYFYPLVQFFIKNQQISDQLISTNDVYPAVNKVITGVNKNYNTALWYFSSAFDYVSYNNIKGQFVSSITLKSDNVVQKSLSVCLMSNCEVCNKNECYKCNSGYYLSKGFCQATNNKYYFFNATPNQSTNTADLIFSPINEIQNDFTVTFFFKFVGWFINPTSTNTIIFDILKLGSFLALRINISTKKLELYNPKNNEVLAFFDKFFDLRLIWTHISVSFSLDPLRFGFYVNFNQVNVNTPLDKTIFISEKIILSIPKESYAFYARLWVYNKFLSGPTNISYMTRMDTVPVKKLLEVSSTDTGCITQSDLSANRGYTCGVESNSILDETNFCKTTSTLPNDIPTGIQGVALTTCTCPWAGDIVRLNDNCYLTCPSGYIPNQYGYCIDSNSLVGFIYNGIVVSSCPVGYEPEGKYCIACQKLDKYYYNGKCQFDCPDYYGKYTVNLNSTCLDCFSTTNITLYYNGKCVHQCSDTTIIEINLQGRKKCLDCESTKPLIFNNTCVENCPYNFGLFNNTILCSNCTTFNKIYFKTSCVDSCPSNTVYDSDENTCKLPLISLLSLRSK
jgi:hypothetical protein